MSHVGRASWKRFAALGLAGALAVAGLWLAVGAGASGGESVRKAGYPVTYNYRTEIDKVSFGKIARTSSHKVKFKFHVEAKHGEPLRFVNTKCKRDDRRYKGCESPKRYRHLNEGRHKFKVKAVFDGCGGGPNCDASEPDKYVWKVK